MYDREEGGVLKYSFEFSKILFSQHGQLLFAPWRGSRTKIISVFLLALSVSLLKNFFFQLLKESVKYLVLFFFLPLWNSLLNLQEQSYFNNLLHLNKKPAIPKDLHVQWIVILQPKMPLMWVNLNVYARAGPKSKVLVRLLDVYDRKWGMTLGKENNHVVVDYLSCCGKRKFCNLKLQFFSSSCLPFCCLANVVVFHLAASFSSR